MQCGRCLKVCPAGAHRIAEGKHVINRSLCTHCMQCATSCHTGALEPCLQTKTVDELCQEILKDKDFYGLTGGVTLSGGEPMLYAKAVARLLRQASEAGDTDDKRHLENTGVSIEKILENLRTADACGAVTRLRCIMIRSVNLNEAHLAAIARLYGSLHHCQGVELLPYHTYGEGKYQQLGRDSNTRKDWIPTAKELAKVKKFLRQYVRLL